MTNRMCELAGVELAYADLGAAAAGRRHQSSIRADQFYGKVMTTAAREYLEMRKSAGPATPREVYDALVSGGLQFDTNNELHRLAGLRAVLRKNSGIFHKLPNGQYGLTSWYSSKVTKKDENPPAQTLRKRHAKRVSTRTEAVPTRSTLSLGPAILESMTDGGEWNLSRLKQDAMARHVAGVDQNTPLAKFQGTLLALRRQGAVAVAGKGLWRLAPAHPVQEAA
jgi:hypothetical protein